MSFSLCGRWERHCCLFFLLLCMRPAISLLLGCFPVLGISQGFSVGYTQINFTDPNRSNRSIPTDIYYPATSNGTNTPIVNGSFPVLVLGHGFLMDVSSYRCFADSLVPYGYILLLPRTEGGIPPNHQQFGLDLRFLNEQMKVEGQTPTSFFYQRVASTSAIMGHSMGGGASFLAAASYTGVTTVVNFAAAETNPSAIQAAKQVTVPVLMFIGENDGVTPPAQHQLPMFDSCASACKIRATILGGGHCYFADPSTTCSFGEATTSPQPSIPRAEQQRRVFGILRPYLGYRLKGNPADSIEMMAKLNVSTEVTYVRQCGSISTSLPAPLPAQTWWIDSPSTPQEIRLRHPHIPEGTSFRILSAAGRRLYEGTLTSHTTAIPTHTWPSGVYLIQIGTESRRWIKP